MDAAVAEEMIIAEKKKDYDALFTLFQRYNDKLTSRAYWFLLSMIWSVYPDPKRSPFWISHFSSKRKFKDELMHSHEKQLLDKLPNQVIAYRPRITEYSLSFTVDAGEAVRIADHCGIDSIATYLIPKQNIIALFNRVRRLEIVVVDQKGIHLTGVKSIEAYTE